MISPSFNISDFEEMAGITPAHKDEMVNQLNEYFLNLFGEQIIKKQKLFFKPSSKLDRDREKIKIVFAASTAGKTTLMDSLKDDNFYVDSDQIYFALSGLSSVGKEMWHHLPAYIHPDASAVIYSYHDVIYQFVLRVLSVIITKWGSKFVIITNMASGVVDLIERLSLKKDEYIFIFRQYENFVDIFKTRSIDKGMEEETILKEIDRFGNYMSVSDKTVEWLAPYGNYFSLLKGKFLDDITGQTTFSNFLSNPSDYASIAK